MLARSLLRVTFLQAPIGKRQDAVGIMSQSHIVGRDQERRATAARQ